MLWYRLGTHLYIICRDLYTFTACLEDNFLFFVQTTRRYSLQHLVVFMPSNIKVDLTNA